MPNQLPKRRCIITMLAMLVAPIGSANATIYYDYPSWQAAINTLGPTVIGPYSGNVTETIIIGTASNDADGFFQHDITYKTLGTYPSSFNNLDWGFTQLGDEADRYWGEPNATFSAPTELILHFNPRILGFYSLTASGGASGGLINGEYIGEWYGNFFGVVVNPTDTLDFTGNLLCDCFSYLNMENIQVAIPITDIDEPSTLAVLLITSLVGLLASHLLPWRAKSH